MRTRRARAARLTFAVAIAATALTAPAAEAARIYSTTGTDRPYVSIRNGGPGFDIGTLYKENGGPNTPTNMHFHLQSKSANGSWGYGRVFGSTGDWATTDGNTTNGQNCAWVLMDGMAYTGNDTAPAPNCPAPGDAVGPTDGTNTYPGQTEGALSASRIFARNTWTQFDCTLGCTFPAVVTAPCSVYGNYDPKTRVFSNKYPVDLPAGRGTRGRTSDGVADDPRVTSGYSGFGWRYQSRDGVAVMIKDTQSPAGGSTYTAATGKPVPNWHFVRSTCIQRTAGPAREG